MSKYCDVAPGHPLHGPYHDLEYGFPVTDDDVLFERLCLEILQAGLSWELILRRRDGLRAALAGFHLATVAAWGEAEAERLLADPRLIRNRRKVSAMLENARRLAAISRREGSIHAWLAAAHPLTLPGWVKRFRSELVFCGPEVVNEFLLSLGWLEGAHRPDCPVASTVRALKPPWLAVAEGGPDA